MKRGFSVFAGEQNWSEEDQHRGEHQNWGQRHPPTFQGDQEFIPSFENNRVQRVGFQGNQEQFPSFENIQELHPPGLRENQDRSVSFDGHHERSAVPLAYDGNQGQSTDFQGSQVNQEFMPNFENNRVQTAGFQGNQELLPPGLDVNQDWHEKFNGHYERSVDPQTFVGNWEQQMNFHGNQEQTQEFWVNESHPQSSMDKGEQIWGSNIQASGYENGQQHVASAWGVPSEQAQQGPEDGLEEERSWVDYSDEDECEQTWTQASRAVASYQKNEKQNMMRNWVHKAANRSQARQEMKEIKKKVAKQSYRNQLMNEPDETAKLFNPAWRPSRKRWTTGETRKRKRKAPIKFGKSRQYLSGNFRGALQEHLGAEGRNGVLMNFETNVKFPNQEPQVQQLFISECHVRALDQGFYPSLGSGLKPGQKLVGSGHAFKKKSSVHFAALDIILQLGLVTMEEHIKNFPEVATIPKFEKVEQTEFAAEIPEDAPWKGSEVWEEKKTEVSHDKLTNAPQVRAENSALAEPISEKIGKTIEENTVTAIVSNPEKIAEEKHTEVAVEIPVMASGKGSEICEEKKTETFQDNLTNAVPQKIIEFTVEATLLAETTSKKIGKTTEENTTTAIGMNPEKISEEKQSVLAAELTSRAVGEKQGSEVLEEKTMHVANDKLVETVSKKWSKMTVKKNTTAKLTTENAAEMAEEKSAKAILRNPAKLQRKMSLAADLLVKKLVEKHPKKLNKSKKKKRKRKLIRILDSKVLEMSFTV